MQVNYSADVSELDAPAAEAAAERPGKPIRVRIPLLIFRLKKDAAPGAGSYRSWNNVSWIVECDSVSEAIELRDALEAFFTYAKANGLNAAHLLLDKPASTQ